MAAVRHVARRLHWGVTGLFALGVVVQFLLAGFAMFGAITWEAHETLGFTALHLLALLVFLLALVAWLRPADLGLSFLVALLATVQVALPAAESGWIAGLHPTGALVLFMLAHVVMLRNRRGTALRAAPPPAV